MSDVELSPETRDALDADQHVLVVAPDGVDTEETVCHHLLTDGDPDEESVLTVELSGSPAEKLATWRRDDVERPRNVMLLSVGDWAGLETPPGVRVESITNHRDLPRLGIKITDLVGELDEDTPGEVALCFDSLTVLLQYLDFELVFRFIHTFRSRLDSYDVRVHYHLDPEQVGEEATGTVRTLFDTVLEIDDDGACTVHSE
ncbi:DUF7504 family protein [Halorarius halobius]|uniref:DUF7504 family protein n=1 Tax=Halorarius halobius TaxID=2962671 RepID=UPI0020CF698A|nr:hypothetical protein [Halorarius halobius]